MRAVLRRSAGVAFACALIGSVVGIAAGQGAAQAPPAQQPWPEASVLAERRAVAEQRALFASDTPLEFTLTADFKAVNRDRNPESTKVFPATITFAGADGAPMTVPVNIRTRGHSRRLVQTCSFAPIRIEFERDKMKGTLFEGHNNIKLGTHCRDADLFEQYVPREYTAYRIFNLLTPHSFRARLAKATYVDAATSKPLSTARNAMFIEDDDDVARRLEGRIVEREKMVFRLVDYEAVTLMTLFEYMIGNTDVSIYALHNIVLVQRPKATTLAVPYDFDYSGLVDARYAIPSKQHSLTSVRDRLYLGPCRTAAEFEPHLTKMQSVKADVMALFDTIPGLDEGYRKDSKKYIEAFYQTISKPGDAKKAFIDNCNNRAGM